MPDPFIERCKRNPSASSSSPTVVTVRPDKDPCDHPTTPLSTGGRGSVSPPSPNSNRIAWPSAYVDGRRPTATECQAVGTSSRILAPTVSTTPSAITLPPNDNTPTTLKAEPIYIPPSTLQPRDINRVPTPLSARGDRVGHVFSHGRTPSPKTFCTFSPEQKHIQFQGDYKVFGRLGRPRSNSSSSTYSIRPRTDANMHAEQYGTRYPASPLSPKLSSGGEHIPTQSNQRRGNHGRQASRHLHIPMPLPGRYHPSNFPQADSLAATPSSAVQSPAILLNRVTQPVQLETPRLMRDKQREFIEKARLSSKLAASPLSVKPEAPRLDPLGSPKGAVTPLTLEEPGDYFQVASSGRRSPASSPGARSPRSETFLGKDEMKVKKSRKVDIYH